MVQVITSANSVVGAAAALVLSTSETLQVETTGYLISTASGGVQLTGTGATYVVTIAGTVLSNSAAGDSGLIMGVSNSTLDLTVAQSGTIHGRSHGVVVGGFADIDNRGAISSDTGFGLINVYSGNYYIENSGLIASAKSTAVSLTGAGVHTLNNSGIIKGGTNAGARSFLSSNANGNDNIGNFGWIYGDIVMNGGNDGYSGASGRLFGKVYLGDGVDKATGGIDNDWFEGGANNDVLRGNSGIDRLFGQDDNDTLGGDAGNDILDGGNGKDSLTGNAGADNLTGGPSADRFIFLKTADSRTAGGRDTIEDFSRAQGDRIVLSAIDANTTLGGNQSFKFIGTAAFSGAAGELRYQKNGGNSNIFADTNGDGVADMHIISEVAQSFVKGDFVL
jgi:serralysin